MNEAVILVGHGGLPTDISKDVVRELKALESQRHEIRARQMSPRESELDKIVREWPRTFQTDPYKWGLDSIAEKLKIHLTGTKLIVAYNEFCAPSLNQAIDDLVQEGIKKIKVVTTMVTPGGMHSEKEIPEIVKYGRNKHPGVTIEYAWPFDMTDVADFLAGHLKKTKNTAEYAGKA